MPDQRTSHGLPLGRGEQAFDHERVLRAAGRIERQSAFATEQCAHLHLSSFAGCPVAVFQDAAGHDPLEDAQELAFQAMEATGAEAAALARQALDLNPACVDALCVLAAQERSLATREAGLRAAVSAAQERLQPLTAQDTLRNLWSSLEARPALRAKALLAACLEAQGRLREAATQWEERLSLDLPDTQGCRFGLVRCYFALHALKPLQELLHTYREDQGPVLAWARVLERLRAHSPHRAEQLLKKAREANPYVEPYLTGRLPLPGATPQHAAPGTPEEAQVVMTYLGAAWSLEPEATLWLARLATPES